MARIRKEKTNNRRKEREAGSGKGDIKPKGKEEVNGGDPTPRRC